MSWHKSIIIVCICAVVSCTSYTEIGGNWMEVNERVVMIDDSIVRGTTSQRIVKLLREAGATEVHMRVTAPPFTNPCYFGTDVDSKENLIACRMSHEEIEKSIGVDSLGYLSVEDAKKLAPDSDCGFCVGCFTGEYPVDTSGVRHKDKFEEKLKKL